MGDLYRQSPRMVGAIIRLHPAEIANLVQQQDVVQSFTPEELSRILETLKTELTYRTKGE